MLLLIVVSIACYAMSLAPVTWVLIAELFPNRIRGAAMSIAVLALWVACAALTLLFPWFFAMRSWTLVFTHVIFGALAGGVYESLEVEEFVAA